MRKFPRTALALVAVAVAASVAVTATSASTKKAAATAEVCVLLPDSKSSVRWETQDRRFLAAAFQRLGDSVSIVNAEGSASTQLNQAQQCLTNGAKVILLVNLDSGSGAAIEKLAKSKGAQTVDYDRLTLKGSASYYVSFDNVSVGKLQGQGLINCLNHSGAIKKKPVIADAQRLADRQQREAVRAGLQLDPEPEVQERDAQEGPGPVGAGLGQPEGPHDLPGHADPDEEQHPGRRGGQRRPRQRGHLGPEVGRPQADPGHRPGCDGAGRPEHHLRLAVHDRLQVDQDAGRRGRDRRRRHPAGEADQHAGQDHEQRQAQRAVGAPKPVAITKNNWKLLISDGFLKKSDVCTGEYAKYC